MKPETILRAVASAKPEYLEQAAEDRTQKQHSLRSSHRFAPLAAVIAIALLITGVAAAVVYGPKIFIREYSNGDFALVLQGGQTAEDAPGYLAQYYLPTELPEESTLNNGGLSWLLHLDWSVHTASSDGQITYIQHPLYNVAGDYSFAGMPGDLNDREQGSCVIADTEYWTLTHRSDWGDATWYYWLDPAHHYIFEAFFNEGISQTDREAFLRSVTAVDTQEVYAALGLRNQPVWYLGSVPEGLERDGCGLDVSADGSVVIWSGASDNLGHDIRLFQDMPPMLDDLTLYTETELEVDGVAVRCLTRQIDVEYEIWQEETWCFTASDGTTELYLTFFSTDEVGLPEADKLTTFRSIAKTAAQNFDIAEFQRR